MHQACGQVTEIEEHCVPVLLGCVMKLHMVSAVMQLQECKFAGLHLRAVRYAVGNAES